MKYIMSYITWIKLSCLGFDFITIYNELYDWGDKEKKCISVGHFNKPVWSIRGFSW